MLAYIIKIVYNYIYLNYWGNTMSTDKIFLLNAVLFFIIYAMRYKDELFKRLIIFAIGSAIAYLIMHLLIFKKDYFNIYTLSSSILLFIALDWIYYLVFVDKKK